MVGYTPWYAASTPQLGQALDMLGYLTGREKFSICYRLNRIELHAQTPDLTPDSVRGLCLPIVGAEAVPFFVSADRQDALPLPFAIHRESEGDWMEIL